ncbi:hypothetical protein BDA96_06G213700 [Sorghum bicolor]|uniref:Uncharacterized protein n=1 Tax=Sorghum bicolor TaxID=4558 RepID=A0A921QV93_SORBI|nr:hypothetical protein BDA96_06G213700 [Sorghum bicolor]
MGHRGSLPGSAAVAPSWEDPRESCRRVVQLAHHSLHRFANEREGGNWREREVVVVNWWR